MSSFHVSESGSDEHKIILLEDTSTSTKAEIFAFGALLNSFFIRHNEADRNMIDGYKSTADAITWITPSFKSTKLSPFVCRLKEGRYTFANHKYKIEKYYSQREALHGLLYDAVFNVVEKGTTDSSAFVTLTYDYNKTDAGFPFFYHITVTYTLHPNNHITLTTKVANLSDSSMPLADGWHPYFSFGKKVNSLQLFMNTTQKVEFDDRLLPTGKFLPYNQFTHPQLLLDTDLDNCFVLYEYQLGAACIITDPEDRLRLAIYPDKSYPYLQVFIPPHRNSIAVENLSGLPDSFNNAIGLLVLEPSQSHEFTTSYIIDKV